MCPPPPPVTSLPACLCGRLAVSLSLSLSGLYLSSRKRRTSLYLYTCVCVHSQHQCAWQGCQTLYIFISSLCLESKADMGQMQTSPTQGETLTDILIEFNIDLTCRPMLLLCTVSRHASLSCTFCNTGSLVLQCCWIFLLYMQTEQSRTLGFKIALWKIKVSIMNCTRTEADNSCFRKLWQTLKKKTWWVIVKITANHSSNRNKTDCANSIKTYKTRQRRSQESVRSMFLCWSHAGFIFSYEVQVWPFIGRFKSDASHLTCSARPGDWRLLSCLLQCLHPVCSVSRHSTKSLTAHRAEETICCLGAWWIRYFYILSMVGSRRIFFFR